METLNPRKFESAFIIKTKFARNVVTATVLSSIALVYLIVYLTGGVKFVYAHLMYIPLVLAGLTLGFKFGVFSALIAGILLGPFMPLDTITHEPQNFANWFFRLIMFCVISLLSGFASDVFKRHNEIIKNIWTVNQETGIPNINSLSEIRFRKRKHNHSVITVLINNHYNIIDYFGMDIYNILVYKVYLELKKKLSKNAIIIQSDSSKLWICDKYITLETKVEHINELLKIPFTINGIPLYVEFSIGIAKIEDFKMCKYADAYRHSDLAARYAQVNDIPYYIFEPKLLQSRGDFELISSFNQAISEGQLRLAYQPKFDTNTLKPVGLEGLIRWYHPTKGLIMPDQFIPLIEETQLIHLLTLWVIEQAVKKIEEFKKERIDVTISVNISCKNLFDEHFYDNVMSIIKKSKINTTQLELEITESVLMSNPEVSYQILKKFANEKFKISLDDFGKGYSSLGYLSKFPINFVKIDRFFVKEITNNEQMKEIVSVIVYISHNLGAKIIAEGIEDKNTLDLVKRLGCEIAQGYFYAKPIEDSKIIDWYKSALV